MLDIRRTAIALDEEELFELERIMIDCDEKEAPILLKKSVHHKIAHSQHSMSRSYLDTGGGPVRQSKKGGVYWLAML